MIRELTEHITADQYRDIQLGGKIKLPGPDATESLWQAKVEALFTSEGWLIYHARNPQKDNPGFPDLWAVHPVYVW
jgi:hypothetical protein